MRKGKVPALPFLPLYLGPSYCSLSPTLLYPTLLPKVVGTHGSWAVVPTTKNTPFILENDQNEESILKPKGSVWRPVSLWR